MWYVQKNSEVRHETNAHLTVVLQTDKHIFNKHTKEIIDIFD
jgi:hypothetical protein